LAAPLDQCAQQVEGPRADGDWRPTLQKFTPLAVQDERTEANAVRVAHRQQGGQERWQRQWAGLAFIKIHLISTLRPRLLRRAGASIEPIRAGRLHALAVTTTTRSEALPATPALGVTLLPGAPADFANRIAVETGKWARVIKLVGIRPN
jgi:hypothetical protein